MNRAISLKNLFLLRPQAALCGLLVLLTGSLINLTLIGSTLWRLSQQSQEQSSPADQGLETPNGPAGTGP